MCCSFVYCLVCTLKIHCAVRICFDWPDIEVNNWLIDWLTDWLIDCDWLGGWLVDWLVGWLVGRSICRYVGILIDWLIFYIIRCLTQMYFYLTDLLTIPSVPQWLHRPSLADSITRFTYVANVPFKPCSFSGTSQQAFVRSRASCTRVDTRTRASLASTWRRFCGCWLTTMRSQRWRRQ